jgi:hypothetical protein
VTTFKETTISRCFNRKRESCLLGGGSLLRLNAANLVIFDIVYIKISGYRFQERSTAVVVKNLSKLAEKWRLYI